ncbi:2-(1,2-epoxy-1,2-dihydrophenyl)acetyl-CoA isomerase [Putridiphycobacter roseus]|uniref:2-(1,2-epoxy-1,2-dihydrophenyl)acetyl-CoA isomerase n=1 Tax=Putridiphycobacter roseus TaxID=2219161 RepID=A0A2W1MX68_9FLAO|nr:enoyl-CoA hydratase-related protein [Putridiphycobacter roseus]PZE15760.1 2-(1,2-epoxy-1,2-dihydrophenyl)acetyl-CoA isomerase [Putridiphycobacter roseus]
MSSISFQISNNVGYITLNRPTVFNSFNQEMAFSLHKILDECNANDEVRAIHITGEGKAFCAGQDLQEVTDPNGPELSSIVSDHYNPIVARLRSIEKPIIAAVNGVAAGAGANIALACDICVAHEAASFIQAFSKIGLIPDSAGTYFLPRLIGMQRATALMMLGDKIAANDAVAMGMIYQAFSEAEFVEGAKKIAEKLAKMPTKGLGLTKRALNQSFNNDLNQQLALEGELQTIAGETYDYNEGVNAFLEKRKPTFKGK